MSFEELIDQMSIDGQELLASETITVFRVRPQGDFDLVTHIRAEVADNDTLSAVTGEERRFRDGNRWMIENMFTVRAEDTSFRPSSAGRLVDSKNKEWSITSCTDAQNGIEYIITAQRPQ